MKYESTLTDQYPSLTLFEDMFGTLTDESKTILIHYNPGKSEPKPNRVSDKNVCSVNGCSTPDDFKRKLMKILDDSFKSLFHYLSQSDEVYRTIQIKSIRMRLQDLTSIISEETIIIHEGFGKYPHHKQFKTFKKPEFTGFDEEDHLKCGQWMMSIAEEYAEVWLGVIEKAISRIDMIHEFLDNTPGEEQRKEEKVPMVKLDNTVSEIGYILNLLIRSGSIIVPPRKISEFINMVAKNVQSKNSVFIKPSSLRNKYTVPDFKAVDTWKEKIDVIRDMICGDEEIMAR